MFKHARRTQQGGQSRAGLNLTIPPALVLPSANPVLPYCRRLTPRKEPRNDVLQHNGQPTHAAPMAALHKGEALLTSTVLPCLEDGHYEHKYPGVEDNMLGSPTRTVATGSTLCLIRLSWMWFLPAEPRRSERQCVPDLNVKEGQNTPSLRRMWRRALGSPLHPLRMRRAGRNRNASK